MSKSGNRNSNLRAKIRVFIILTIVGAVAILAALLSLFLFEIEDTIYADGVIIPEHTFELVGHVDAHVKKFNFRTGDDVKEGEAHPRKRTSAEGALVFQNESERVSGKGRTRT